MSQFGLLLPKPTRCQNVAEFCRNIHKCNVLAGRMGSKRYFSSRSILYIIVHKTVLLCVCNRRTSRGVTSTELVTSREEEVVWWPIVCCGVGPCMELHFMGAPYTLWGAPYRAPKPYSPNPFTTCWEHGTPVWSYPSLTSSVNRQTKWKHFLPHASDAGVIITHGWSSHAGRLRHTKL